MKLLYWVTITVASVCWGPAGVFAQGGHGVQGWMPSVPHIPANRMAWTKDFMLHGRSVPNRRIPSLAPPRSRDLHPVTPDRAWPGPLSSIKPTPRSLKSSMGERTSGDMLFDDGRLDVEKLLGD